MSEGRSDTSFDTRNNDFLFDGEVAKGLSGKMSEAEAEPASLTDKLSEVIVSLIPYVVSSWGLGVLILSTLHVGSHNDFSLDSG